jgi:hypothetical protein
MHGVVAADLASLQRWLAPARGLNVAGSRQPHVVVMLPSFNLAPRLLAHYSARIPALEHRYLLDVLMLSRVPGAEAVFITSQAPAPEVLEYYFALVPEPVRAEVARRLTMLEVQQRGDAPVAAKLLSREDLLAQVRDHIGSRRAFIEPWTVCGEEAAVALALQVPIRGTAPDLRRLGFKSNGRRLFHQAGVPVAPGVEDLHSPFDVLAAVTAMKTWSPGALGAVLKLDDGVAGDGNVVIRFDENIEEALERMPQRYVAELADGGVVEELITGASFRSPSVLLELEPDGRVVVLATHEQVLGGQNGQVFVGCRFPSDIAYAGQLARYGSAIGRALIRRGALGRVSVDFAAIRDRTDRWSLYALEMNLRKGGTSHPYSALRNLVPGSYDPVAGQWFGEDGRSYFYECSDNLLDPTWKGMSTSSAVAALDTAGLAFDPKARTGVVLHMLPGLATDGRVGAVAIEKHPTAAHERLCAVTEALTTAA